MNAKALHGIRIALGVLGVVFLLFGIARGEVKTVFQKASVICTECIGIG